MRPRFRLADTYRPPLGAPFHWQDDTSGALPAAVRAFAGSQIGQAILTPEQFALVRAYCEYWIVAPCWRTQGLESEFRRLRRRIRRIDSPDQLAEWVLDCVALGVDPF